MKPLSEARLNMIGAQSLRWPGHTTMQWEALRNVITAVRKIVRDTDAAIVAIANDADLSDTGRLRRMGEVALRGIDTLDALPAMTLAERRVNEFLTRLDEKRGDIPNKPSAVADVMLHAEIRAHIAKQKDPLMFATNKRSEPLVLAAVLHAPAFLSGMSDEQKNILEQAAANALWPDDEKHRSENADALEVARQAVRQGKNLIADLGQLQKTGEGYELRPLAAA